MENLKSNAREYIESLKSKYEVWKLNAVCSTQRPKAANKIVCVIVGNKNVITIVLHYVKLEVITLY